jgi:hypothetical protein
MPEAHGSRQPSLLARCVGEFDAACDLPVEERQFDGGSQSHFAQPRPGTDKVTDAHVGDLAETGKGRFDNDRAESRLFFYGLKQDGSTDRLSHPEDALWVLSSRQPTEPALHVVAFL